MTSAAKVYRFSVFELDVRTGEFRKKHVKIRLQQQPLQVLVALLERPGELVTREELKRRLWPDDTFVDFDHSLNAAVNRLREVLSDSADTPRFVETLPRRGYRFIAPVTSDGPSAEDPSRPTISDLTESPDPPIPSAIRNRRIWYGVAATCVLLLALGARFGADFGGASAHVDQPPLQAVPLTTFEGEEHGPTFSPDGSQVAFYWDGENQDNFDIYVQVIGEPRALRLTDDPAAEIRPAWSPDGRRIAFIRGTSSVPSAYTSEGEAIYVVSPLGVAKRKVADFSYLNANGMAWWPDSKSLVVADRESPKERLRIYRVFVESGEKQLLASPVDPADDDRFPAISPDGKTLAFAEGTSAREQIYLLPMAGGPPQRLTADIGPIYGLTWTADSRGIVYSRAMVDGQWPSLWRISVAGGETQELASLGHRVYAPTISRQGGKLAYDRGLEDSNIWSYDLPSAKNPLAARRIVYSTEIDAAPQISPDGTRIVFASTRTGNCDLWICGRDGSNQEQLTFFGDAHAGSSRWSPDGRQIAFDAAPGGEREIFVISAEGGLPRRLTYEAGDDSRPSWSRDGKWVYFNSVRGGAFQIWKIPAEGGQAVQVTQGGGYQPFEDPDGRYLYFAKGRQESSVWRTTLGSRQPGQEEMVLQGLPLAGFRGEWDIAEEGIYFVQCKVRSEHRSGCVLTLFRLDTGKVEQVMALQGAPFGATPLDVAPDGKSFLYVQHDARGSDLMLVEDFR
jgi:Tol biopolymer transport system component/DNA-binding winged helix-turn-helix (wHTH) protein